jgi:polar amino acid transport system ATP-binding protein
MSQPDRQPASPDEGFSIDLAGVTKRFGARLVLDEVSLSVTGGQTVALIGPSGGGKSTLLRCVNGLCPVDAGRVRVGPHELGSGAHASETTRSARRLVGMIFQDFQLFPHLTAAENVMEAPRCVLAASAAAARERAMGLLTRVGLADHADHYPRQLSGGQKQRVAIARALAMEPRGLLCDEITSALDPELKHEVLEVLEGLRADGLMLLVVTHEIGFARRGADRVVVLADGRIVEDGPPAQVLDEPTAPRTRQFLRQVLA